MPSDVSTLLETPIKGHIPRNWVRTMLLTKTVEMIKERLPVWKKEVFEDDSHVWGQNQ